MPLVVRDEEVAGPDNETNRTDGQGGATPARSSTEYLYALNAVSAHSVALLGSREQGRKKMILRAMTSNLKQQESKVDEIIGAVEAIIGQQKPELRSYLHELKMGLQAQLHLQCSDTKIMGKKLKEDPSSNPSLTTWWIHRLNRLVDRANKAIGKIGIAINNDEAIRSDADPWTPKTQVHVSLKKNIESQRLKRRNGSIANVIGESIPQKHADRFPKKGAERSVFSVYDKQTLLWRAFAVK